MKYAIGIDNPKDFYHEMHRPQHFLDFVKEKAEDEYDLSTTFGGSTGVSSEDLI